MNLNPFVHKYYQFRLNLINNETIENLAHSNRYDNQLAHICSQAPAQPCPLTKYRSITGHCNNVYRPLQGAVYEPYQRLANADYADGISEPRSSVSHVPLPNARKISKILFTDDKSQHKDCSTMVAQWAMFVYNDIAQNSFNQLFKDNETKPVPCCNDEFSHSECYPIIAEDDSPDSKGECFPYVRSITAPRENCSLGVREQGNQATSYLDGSHIYGSTKQRAEKLRTFTDGLLKTNELSGKKKVSNPNDDESCSKQNGENSVCGLFSGNPQSNLIISNSAMQILWRRQHNFIAKQLKEINPTWNDEQLYQESRAIVTAQIQYITYNEFLPLIIGINNLRRYGLNLKNYAYDSDYDLFQIEQILQNTDASTLNEFASAAGLFFFSLFPDQQIFQEVIQQNKRSSQNNLLNQGRIDSIIKSIVDTPIRNLGLYISEHFKDKFLKGNGKYGVDLIATIIQLGRDHGLPGYTTYRSKCGLLRPTNFSELQDIVLENVDIEAISTIYENIDDVDLFVLGLAEKPEAGSLVGPTFSCIIGNQFKNIRHGDRYWFENFFTPTAFTLDQLNEIRKTTLARIVCDNSERIKTIQPNTFALVDEFGNCPIDCDSIFIDTLDLKHWSDQETRLKLPITKETIQKALRLGAEHARQLNNAERLRIGNALASKPDLAVITHSNMMAPKRQSLRIAETSAILREATKVLIHGNGLENEEKLPSELDFATLQQLLPEIDVKDLIAPIKDLTDTDDTEQSQCLPKPLPCDHTSKYRTYSGWCNNLKFPHYGNAFSPMRRLLHPEYDDGFDSPRMTAKNGRQLPSARAVSNAVHKEAPVFHVKYSHMLMQIGQLLDHDFAHSPISRGPGNSILDCKRCDSHETVSSNCLPIPVDSNDPHFKSINGRPRCIPFTRSLIGQLTLGYRNQLDQLTSFIDASFMYGSTNCEANALRLFNQGKLNYTNLGFNAEALPQGSQERDCRSQPKHPCFNAGDERSNEQPALTVIHTIFMREHNRIAEQLHKINNLWSDEKIFAETRRIMGAKLQHIIYAEWLPIIIGCETAAKYKLIPKKTGYFKGYDDRCDATMSQEMATAAFRFGHTLIRNTFPRMNGAFQEAAEPLQLKDSFNNASFYYNEKAGHIESLLYGLLGVSSMAFDRHISDALRNHLFQKAGNDTSGMDLISVNIQRGRDHGVQPYNAYREFCGLKKAKSFEELSDVMNESSYLALKSALVGPTVACIIGEQMQRLKKCDRFYYENDNPATRFSASQLAEIRKTKISKLICDNSQYGLLIQPNGFLMPDELTNAPVKCSELPSFDLHEWLDRS
uniref:Chorion peroxidase n=1 Tax=Syphacia muris TaxID=451379 RepID=A0A0N5ABK1_9BILA